MNSVLTSFKVRASCTNHVKVRNLSIYDLTLRAGARVKDVEKFSQEIAISLRAKSTPLLKAMPELGIVRLQVVDSDPERIDFVKRLNEQVRPKGVLPFYIGETCEGKPMWFDMHTAPHLLIAGTTGSGKSTLLHTLVGNAIRFPNLEIHLVDTKQVEFSQYAELNHSDLTIDRTYNEFLTRLEYLVVEMEERYNYLQSKGLPSNYFSNPECPHPYSIVIIDEFADLIMQDQDGTMYDTICKLAQKGRAAGIHLVIATQRPSADILKGALKANFPARIACRVSTRVDSQVILDTPGAQLLLGKGDGLAKIGDYDMQRFQIAYASSDSICGQYVAE